MSEKKPALGRGLADLLGAPKARATAPAKPVPLAPPPGGAGAGAVPGTVASAASTPAASSASTSSSAQSSAPASTAPRGDEMQHVPVGQLVRGKYQPRVDMRQEALEELAISIRQQGVIQPIVVR